MASPEARNQNKQIFNRKLAGHQERNMRRGTSGGQPGIGFWNFRPAIPVVFAEGSLRTHRLALVGIIAEP